MISLILALMWSHLRPSCAKLILGASFILRVRSRNYINFLRSAKKWTLRPQLVLTGSNREATEIHDILDFSSDVVTSEAFVRKTHLRRVLYTSRTVQKLYKLRQERKKMDPPGSARPHELTS